MFVFVFYFNTLLPVFVEFDVNFKQEYLDNFMPLIFFFFFFCFINFLFDLCILTQFFSLNTQYAVLHSFSEKRSKSLKMYFIHLQQSDRPLLCLKSNLSRIMSFAL